jgi:ParB-like chromosome segregation protein Spo0J
VKLIKQRFEMVRLDGDTDPLREHPENPKRGNMEAIGESIDTLGFYGAVLAQESSGYILVGNHRYRDAIKKGAKEIPTFWLDVDDDHARRILLSDNRTAELGHMDEEALEAIMSQLDTLEGTGYGLHIVEEKENTPAPTPKPPGPDDVPEGDHESQWGVVVMCTSEGHQSKLYKELQKLIDNDTARGAWKKAELRVVAI